MMEILLLMILSMFMLIRPQDSNEQFSNAVNGFKRNGPTFPVGLVWFVRYGLVYYLIHYTSLELVYNLIFMWNLLLNYGSLVSY